MTLGEYIKQYRDSANLSQREFARICGLSNAYISIIERGSNPRSEEAFKPSFELCKKIADGMGIALEVLLNAIDENNEFRNAFVFSPAVIGYVNREKISQLQKHEEELLNDYRNLNAEGRKIAERYIHFLLSDYAIKENEPRVFFMDKPYADVDNSEDNDE